MRGMDDDGTFCVSACLLLKSVRLTGESAVGKALNCAASVITIQSKN